MIKKINKLQIAINTLLFVMLPFIVNLIVESFGHKKLIGGIEKLIADPYIFFCNTLIIASTISVGILFKRYRYFWVTIISLAWILLGFSNFLLLSNRVLPLTVHDLQLVDLLSSMIKKYLNPTLLIFVSFGVVILVLGIFILFFKSHLPKGGYSFKKSLIFFIVIISLTVGNIKFATAKGILQTRFPELPRAYLDNGFAYSFSLSVLDNGVDKVDGYSKKLINSITDDFEKTDKESLETPSIIFLQLESFFDVNTLKNVEFSENPIPVFTKLLSENGSGILTVPTIGAGTVNTEFEVVTGMRIMDFGAGEYPYKTILTKSTCESLANNLKSFGYVSHFIHNYKGTFYGRNKVYANLGYDYFCPVESMSGYEINENGWARDSILTKYINESLNSTDGPDLVTTISVQPHGGYANISDYERHVTVTKCKDKSKKASYEYYVNQLYEVDTFVGELIQSLSQREEDVILVVYGDHLPSLDIADSDLSGRGIYETDYFIWNNMGMTFEDEDLYSYQLSSKIFESLGIREGVINSCHQTYKDSENYSYYLQALEYDVLYGKKYAYGGKTPYSVSKMKHNNRQLKIKSISKKEDADNLYIVTGSGFTNRTFVMVDSRIVSTTYINENTLEFKYKKLDEAYSLTLWEDKIGLSETVILNETDTTKN